MDLQMVCKMFSMLQVSEQEWQADLDVYEALQIDCKRDLQ